MSKKKTVKLKMDQRVKVTVDGDECQGQVKFIGKTKFAVGTWVGVVLDEPKGKNNGTVKGVSYFQCDNKYGLFCKPGMAKPVSEGKGKKKGKDKKSKGKKKKPSVKKDKKPKKAASKTQQASTKLDEAKANKAAVEKKPQDDKAIKKLNAEISSLKSELSAKDTEIEKLKSDVEKAKKAAKPAPSSAASDGDSAEVQSLKAQLEKLELEKEEAVLTLESQVEELKVDKELSDEQIAGLEEEVEALTEEADNLKLDLESLELEREEWAAGLDPDAADAQAKIEENRKLTQTLVKLKQKYDAEKLENEEFKTDALEKLVKFKEMEDQIIALTDEKADLEENIQDFQEQLDEAGSNEDEIESLNDKILELDAKNEELTKNMAYLDEMKVANEELIIQSEEFSTQLQADCDQKEMEIDELNAQLSLKLKQIEDLHQTQRKFKDHVKHLEAEVLHQAQRNAQNEGASSAGDEQYRAARKANMQLQQRVSEVRGKTVDYVRSKIEKEEFASKMRFFEMHIPDNLDIDQAAIQLVLTLDRLKGKAVESANLLGEFYGEQTHNDSLAAVTYDLCGKLLGLAKQISTLRKCIEKCDDDETFAVVVEERKMLKAPEECIDELLSLISRDEFDVNYDAVGIQDARDNIDGFIAAHFMTDEDDRGNRQLKVKKPLNILLDVKKLNFDQELIATYFVCLSDLFDLVPKKDDQPHAFEDTFDKMKQLCIGNTSICKQMYNLAQTYQLTCENRANASGAGFEMPLKACTGSIFSCGVQVKAILEAFNSMFTKQQPNEENCDGFINNIKERLEAETEDDRLISKLQATQSQLKELSDKIDDIPGSDRGGSDRTIPLWESNAHQVRKDLFESANLKTALEEAVTKVEERDRALFKQRKIAQDKAAKIDVLQSRWDQAQQKIQKQGELEAEAEKLRKRVKQQQDASDVIVKDMGKYQAKNKVLRQKVLKLKVELKAARVNGGGGGGVGGEGLPTLSGKSVNSLKMATHEIDLLVRTISAMRHQLAQVRCANITKNLNSSLPLLPVIWGGAHTVHSTDSSTNETNTAVQNLKSFVPSPFYGKNKNDAQVAQNLSRELCNLSSRVSNFRAAPQLVDVSQIGEKKGDETTVSPGQQWLSRQEEAQQLKDQTAEFNKKLQSFLDSKRSHAFRSMFSTLAAPESAVLGGGGHLGTLIGKVTVPSVNPGGNEKVTIDRTHLSQLHSILVN